eukprot:CAMPEP_0198197272 /NCGR_PEP_ID=MMETSP1445-20131203/879_1 /TAXON_ID=36898 /ORGANISM="Pyramimonas sp., Strain CCMP2087" /LENGTH=743 /DNA_ID=CAMNT_0043866509 /DNA_START=315 /DNA_END=2546 /DNA_ORIENTATION=-
MSMSAMKSNPGGLQRGPSGGHQLPPNPRPQQQQPVQNPGGVLNRGTSGETRMNSRGQQPSPSFPSSSPQGSYARAPLWNEKYNAGSWHDQQKDERELSGRAASSLPPSSYFPSTVSSSGTPQGHVQKTCDRATSVSTPRSASSSPGAGKGLDTTALKFLDSFAPTNGRGSSSPMIHSAQAKRGTPSPPMFSSPSVSKATPTPSIFGSPSVSQKPQPSYSNLSSSPHTAFADIAKDQFFTGPSLSRVGSSSAIASSSRSTNLSAVNLQALDASFPTTRHKSNKSTESYVSSEVFQFDPLDDTEKSKRLSLEDRVASDLHPFAAESFTNFVGASDSTNDPVPSGDEFSAAASPLNTSHRVVQPPLRSPTKVPPTNIATETETFFNLDSMGSASIVPPDGSSTASSGTEERPSRASVQLDSLFDFPSDAIPSTSSSAGNIKKSSPASKGDLFSLNDSDGPSHDVPPSQLDPFGEFPDYSASSAHTDLDRFFSALPGGGKPSSEASPLEDFLGPAAQTSKGPALGGNQSSVDDLFGKMNVSISKTDPQAPARDIFAAGLSALYGDRDPGYTQGAHKAQSASEVSEVSWDAADAVHAKEEQGEEGEPEIRAQLRRARMNRVNARVQQSLIEKRGREQEEHKQQQAREQAECEWGVKLHEWIHNNKGNIRALLGSMETVLWDGHKWTSVKMTDLITPASVKKAYRKALLVVHPDKVKQSSPTPLKMYIADTMFDCLKEAWGSFEASEGS